MREPQESFDGEFPRSGKGAHRAFQPWSKFELGPKERASQIRLYPVRQLVAALTYCELARGRVVAIAAGDLDPREAAAFYVWRKGKTRDTMAEVFQRAAAGKSDDPRIRLMAVATEPVWVDAQLEDWESDRWWNSKDFPRAAAMLSLIGADRCIATVNRKPGEFSHRGRPAPQGGIDLCGANKFEARSSRWCADHYNPGLASERQDRESITALLRAVDLGL